ncbi:unnamed protein product [Paramecium primaurelia]|uniref:Major facilitator superfamily (MFS) profile domain-containing protein n=1 Tax=Paramecium primaurelia TaxID=5886 RepID=A0A8S1L0R0_PARPR|nr:unnamed protein product [Paramecium primaurelia]
MHKTHDQLTQESQEDLYNENKSASLLGVKSYQQYAYRWIILICFLSVVFINGIAYQTFIPNAKQFIELYDVSEQIITLSGTIFLIMQPLFTFFASSFIVKKGFALSLNFGVLLTIVGYGIRLLINKFSFSIVILGQACLGISRPFILNGQITMAQNWFYPSNRTAVLTACNAFQTFSMIISVIWPANWIFQDYSYTEELKEKGLELSLKLQYQQFFLSLVLIPVIFLIRNNPATPPSGFKTTESDVGVQESIIKLLKNGNFILILLTYSFYFGTIKGYGLNVPYLMSPFGFIDTHYSIASSMLIIGGFISAGMVSKIVQKFKKYKAIGIVLLTISLTLTLLTYPIMMTEQFIPLCIQQLLLGFFLIPMVPVLMEFGCEAIYPLNGSFSIGVMVSGATIAALLSSILLTYTAKGKDSDKLSALITTIIWCSIFLIGFIFFLLTKEIENRSKEQEEKERKNFIKSDSSNKNHQTSINESFHSEKDKSKEDFKQEQVIIVQNQFLQNNDDLNKNDKNNDQQQ